MKKRELNQKTIMINAYAHTMNRIEFLFLNNLRIELIKNLS